jgi:hypothetical protein
MKLRPITEKEKPKKGIGCFLIILIIVGFAISVYLFGLGWLKEIVHP